ncbi:MAG TPA: non-heme iron oxygenase ferredoxin subunit [Gemmatimonadaceae bacterium]|nr:non-heme iron oxygenase ferredoxin subunit [Gemmatimonadaceae bacterium]
MSSAAKPALERVAAVEDVPPGSLRGVTLSNGDKVCLVNLGSEIRALGNVCTHQEFAMSDGALIPGGLIECAWHGARFDCRTGAVKRFPATDPLPVYDVRVEHDEIWVGGRVR